MPVGTSVHFSPAHVVNGKALEQADYQGLIPGHLGILE
jgi:hypothetical protein